MTAHALMHPPQSATKRWRLVEILEKAK